MHLSFSDPGNKYIHIRELETSLGKSRQTIYRQLKEHKIEPINIDTYRSDGGYTFLRQDVELFLKKRRIPMTLKEAATYLGMTPQYLSYLRNRGDIEAEEIQYGKQIRLAFTKESCDRYLEKRKKALNYSTLVPFNNGYRLFQVIKINGREKGRIVRTTPPTVLWENGVIEEYDEIGTEENWTEYPYVREKGFAIFRFPIPRSPFHPVYDLLYRIMEEIGTSNITISENTEGDYEVKVRNCQWSGTEEDMMRLQSALIKGTVTKEEEFVIIHSDEHPITVYFRQKELEAFQQLKREEETIGDYIVRVVRKNM